MSFPAFYSRCLERCGLVWGQAASHPFVQGLANGTLSPAQIQCYLVQDGLYLKGYVQVCRALARRSLADADRILFEDSARLSEEGELEMQETLSKALGLPAFQGASPLPATEAYSAHERASVENASRLVALAGATPCNVLYAEVGSQLSLMPQAAASDHPFRLWLDLYADAAVQEMAAQWIETLNRWAEGASVPEQEQALNAFAVSMQCEVDFWEQAWQADSSLPPPSDS